MKKIVPLLFYFLPLSFSSVAQGWSGLGIDNVVLNQKDNQIYTICSDKMGNIYVAGMIFDSNWHMIVGKWNGSSWTALGAGNILLDSLGEIDQILTDTNGNVYVAGTKSSLNNVLKWNGTSWSKVGSGLAMLNANGQISTIFFDRYGNIYAAGAFTDTSGYSYVAKWDGSSWSELGLGSNALKANAPINMIIVDTSGNVYAAGCFTDSVNWSGGNVYVAKWDGTSWSELGVGVSHQLYNDTHIFSIVEDASGNIYAAGANIMDSGYNYVAKWDGTSWSKLGAGTNAFDANNSIASLCIDRYGNLYASGWFTDSATALTATKYVAKWDGTSWTELGTGSDALNANGTINFICSDEYDNIYAGGNFTDTAITLLDGTLSYHPVYIARYSVSASVAALHPISGVKVYPNPAQDIINVSFELPGLFIDNSNYSIYDITGKLCISGKLQAVNTQINISGLLLGVYMLNVGNSQGVYRVVKE